MLRLDNLALVELLEPFQSVWINMADVFSVIEVLHSAVRVPLHASMSFALFLWLYFLEQLIETVICSIVETLPTWVAFHRKFLWFYISLSCLFKILAKFKFNSQIVIRHSHRLEHGWKIQLLRQVSVFVYFLQFFDLIEHHLQINNGTIRINYCFLITN